MPTENDEMACLVLETYEDFPASTGNYGFSCLSNILLERGGRRLLHEVLVSSRPTHEGLLKVLGVTRQGPHRYTFLPVSASDYFTAVNSRNRAADLQMFMETAAFEILFCLARDGRLLDVGARRQALLFTDEEINRHGVPEEVSRAAKTRVREDLVVICFSHDMEHTYIFARSFPTGEMWE